MVTPLPARTHNRATARVVLVLIAVLAVVPSLAVPNAEAATTVVKVGQGPSGGASQRFNPAVVTVSAGDSIRWEWFSGSHDVQSENAAGLSSGPKGGMSGAGQSYSYTFTRTGTYTYYCDNHAGPGDADLDEIDRSIADGKMVGKVIVQPAVGGGLSLQSQPIRFPAASLSGLEQTLDAEPTTWQAGDTTGLGNGWNITISGGDFSGPGASSIPIDRMSVRLLQTNIQVLSGNTAPLTRVPAFQPLANSVPTQILRAGAGTGMGTYTFAPEFRLALPPSLPIGDYAAHFVVTIVSGP